MARRSSPVTASPRAKVRSFWARSRTRGEPVEENQRQAAPAPARSLPQRSVLGKWVQEVRILHPIVGCMDLCEVEIGKNIQSRGPEVLQLPHH